MNKNKKNKLTIKSNWDKELTISPLQMNRIIGGDGDCVPNGTKTDPPVGDESGKSDCQPCF